MQRVIGVMGRLLDQDDGLGIYAARLLEELLRMDVHSRYVIFLQSDKTLPLFEPFPNAAPCVLRASRKFCWDQLAVPLAARRHDVDLIFNPKFSAPLLSGRPCVFVHQGSDWYVNPGNYPWWDNLYIRLMLPLYHRKARRTLAISQATIDDLQKHTRMDFSRCTVSGAGVASNFTPQRNPAELTLFRMRYDLPPRYILTVARVLHGADRKERSYPGGNTVRLLHAYRLYRQGGGDLPLVVAGRRIEAYLRAQGCSDADLMDVRFLGFVPNNELHLAYQGADCFVLATLCESFGIPILEALSSGCPAIVPNTCASPEVAGDAARLIDPRDEHDIARALLEVTSSARLREHMRELGIRRARQFTWRETARRTLAVFDQVAPRPARASSGVTA